MKVMHATLYATLFFSINGLMCTEESLDEWLDLESGQTESINSKIDETPKIDLETATSQFWDAIFSAEKANIIPHLLEDYKSLATAKHPSSGVTPLIACISNRNITAFTKLLAANTCTITKTTDYGSPLCYAVLDRAPEFVLAIVSNENLKNQNSLTSKIFLNTFELIQKYPTDANTYLCAKHILFHHQATPLIKAGQRLNHSAKTPTLSHDVIDLIDTNDSAEARNVMLLILTAEYEDCKKEKFAGLLAYASSKGNPTLVECVYNFFKNN